MNVKIYNTYSHLFVISDDLPSDLVFQAFKFSVE